MGLVTKMDKSLMRGLFILLIACAVAGCTTTAALNRPDGSRDFVIACGAGLGWNVCYNRANEVCPSGYRTISQDAGFNRKELTISCPAAPAQALQSAYKRRTYEASASTVTLQHGREEAEARLFQRCMAARAAAPAIQRP